jgi:hypothetical protein
MAADDYKTEFFDVDCSKNPQWYVGCLAAQDAIANIGFGGMMLWQRRAFVLPTPTIRR